MSPRSGDPLDLPPGVEPRGMISFQGGPEEPLLFDGIVHHLQRGAPDEGLALHLTPTRVYATGQDALMFLNWDIADCSVEQSRRKALDKRFFNLVNREREEKTHLYCNDRFDAALIRTIVEHYSERRSRGAKLFQSMRLRGSRQDAVSHDKVTSASTPTSSAISGHRISTFAHKIL